MSAIPDGQEFADCADCGKEMVKGGECTTTILIAKDGQEIDRIRNHREDVCHDCNAGRGAYHHYGCDMERCPGCGCQLLGCDCSLW